MALNKDMSKLPWSDEETSNIDKLADIMVAVDEQAGPNDEEPGIDADDIIEVLLGEGGDGVSVMRYILSGKTTRERIDRGKELFTGVERVFGMIEGRPPREGIGQTTN